jgi:hypothetical protein
MVRSYCWRHHWFPPSPVSSGRRPSEVCGQRTLVGGAKWWGFLLLFLGILEQRLHLEDIIRSSMCHPLSSGASSTDGGRVESCVWRISWDQSFFMFVGVIYVRLLRSTVIKSAISALVRWYFRALARQLLVCLLQQALLIQAISGSSDGGRGDSVTLARTSGSRAR